MTPGPSIPKPGTSSRWPRATRSTRPTAPGSSCASSTATHRFDETGWLQLETTRISRWDTLTPAEFSAGLPIEQLAEAWGDYRAEVVMFNRAVWTRESERREDERQAQAERRDAFSEQRDVAELLDEGGAPER